MQSPQQTSNSLVKKKKNDFSLTSRTQQDTYYFLTKKESKISQLSKRKRNQYIVYWIFKIIITRHKLKRLLCKRNKQLPFRER